MKPVFKCDYCTFMGTEEEVKEHEPNCMDNYDRKSCYTCVHKKGFKMENKLIKYECDCERDVPAGKLFEFCSKYERKEKPNKYDFVDSLFGGFKGF